MVGAVVVVWVNGGGDSGEGNRTVWQEFKEGRRVRGHVGEGVRL